MLSRARWIGGCLAGRDGLALAFALGERRGVQRAWGFQAAGSDIFAHACERALRLTVATRNHVTPKRVLVEKAESPCSGVRTVRKTKRRPSSFRPVGPASWAAACLSASMSSSSRRETHGGTCRTARAGLAGRL
jgi:hypothetical protein